MIDYLTILRRMGKELNEESPILYTCDLKNNGFNTYSIKKAMKDGLLERVEKGKYRLVIGFLDECYSPHLDEVGSKHELSLTYLNQLIDNEDYESLKNILANTKGDNERFKKIILDLVEGIELCKNYNYTRLHLNIYNPNYEHTFLNFFGALSIHDYSAAASLVEKCIQCSFNKKQKEEFILYKKLLDRLCFLIESLEQKNKLDYTLSGLIFEENNVTTKSRQFEDILSKILALETQITGDYSVYSSSAIALDILQMIRSATENKNITLDSFEQFDYANQSLAEAFISSLTNGDYVTAFKILQQSDSSVIFNSSNFQYRYILLYKKLLSKLDSILRKNSAFQYSDDSIIISTLSLLVATEQYEKALYFYQEKGLEIENYNLKQELAHLFEINQTREDVYLSLYEQSLENLDIERAKRALFQYEEFLQEIHSQKSTNHFHQRIQILEYDMKQPNYSKKETLYRAAYSWFKQKEYGMCINVLNQYISLDQGINYKGFALTGACYEKLKDYYRANYFYDKAFKISFDPIYIFRQGEVYSKEGKYELALKYSLSYERDYLQRSIPNLENLIFLEDKLQHKDEKKRYIKILNGIRGAQNSSKLS